MKENKIVFLLSIFVFFIGLAQLGFANEPSLRLPGLTISKTDNIFSGKFLLSSNPDYSFGTQCESLVHLTLDKAEITGRLAILDDSVQTNCSTTPPAHMHIYQLDKTEQECGSTHYFGKRISGSGIATVEIIDHRYRNCKDIVEARIIFVEKTATGTTTLYSVDLPGATL